MSKQQTLGHDVRYGGLRGHSIGKLYPLSVQGWGDDTWQALNLVTGTYHGERSSNYDVAEAHATIAKDAWDRQQAESLLVPEPKGSGLGSHLT